MEQMQKQKSQHHNEEPDPIDELPEPVDNCRLMDAVAYVLELTREVLDGI